jgi:RNA polymerase sigma-70 factor (ECF subfamily)
MERSALERALQEHHEASFGWALACCRWDATEAQDVLHNAYLRVLDGSARFQERSAFRTWLFGVIRNVAAERRRRERVRGLALRRWSRSEPTSEPPNIPERSPASARLVAELAALPQRQREVVHLVFYTELTIEQAAVSMGVGLGTARTHYARAKRRLRERLEGTPGLPVPNDVDAASGVNR